MFGEIWYNGMEVCTMLGVFWYNGMEVCTMCGEIWYSGMEVCTMFRFLEQWYGDLYHVRGVLLQ